MMTKPSNVGAYGVHSHSSQHSCQTWMWLLLVQKQDYFVRMNFVPHSVSSLRKKRRGMTSLTLQSECHSDERRKGGAKQSHILEMSGARARDDTWLVPIPSFTNVLSSSDMSRMVWGITPCRVFNAFFCFGGLGTRGCCTSNHGAFCNPGSQM